MNTLVIDIGGTHVKFKTAHRDVVKIKSSRKLTPEKMLKGVLEATADWEYDRVSIGYPGVVVHNIPVSEPANLGKGWVSFKYQQAFKMRPLRMINDAAMQALGSYTGGRMLFMGLGTGLGSALVVEGVVQAMELAHLPWKKHQTYEDFLGLAGLERDGLKTWTKHVGKAIEQLGYVLECDHIVLGGGNAELIKNLPAGVVRGSNDNAFRGGFMLWKKPHNTSR